MPFFCSHCTICCENPQEEGCKNVMKVAGIIIACNNQCMVGVVRSSAIYEEEDS